MKIYDPMTWPMWALYLGLIISLSFIPFGLILMAKGLGLLR